MDISEHSAPVAAPARLTQKEQVPRYFLRALLVAALVWLALQLGASALFNWMDDAGDWVTLLLPWACLAVAAYFLWRMERMKPAPIAPASNRLKRYAIGWALLALFLIVMALIGETIEGGLRQWLGRKFAGVVVDFTAAHGFFWAAVSLLIAGALLVAGTEDLADNRPGQVERVFVLNLTAKLAAIPMAIVAVAVFLGGTIWTVVYSFTNSKLLPKAQFVGLDQYERLWDTPRWVIAIENLVIYGLCSLVLSFIIGFTLAALMDQKIRFENVFRTIILYPFALSFVVTGLVWQWILNPEFGIQGIVRGAGWVGFTFDPLSNADIVIFGLLIAGLWQGTGFVMVLMLAGLRGIDQEIWKAARVDGIPTWKTYLFVVIPMMRPVFITTLVIIASGIVRLYDLVVAQTSGGPGISSEVPAKYVYDYMFQGQNLGQGFAASTMMLLAVAIVVIPWAYLEFGSRKRV